MRARPALPAAALCLAFALSLSACDDPAPPREPYRPDPSVEASSARLQTEKFLSWQPAYRAAFIEARLRLAGWLLATGEPPATAGAMLAIAGDIYRADPDGLAALGYRPGLIEDIAAAISLERPAEEVSARLDEAGAHLGEVRAGAGAAPADLVGFVMQASAESYEAGVRYGTIERLADYQTAWALAGLGRDIAAGLEGEAYDDLRLELNMLLLMWPSAGPVAEAVPPPEFQMADQFARVRLALASLP